MEAEKTKLLIVSENQKVRVQEHQTQKQQAIIKASSDLEVSKINIEREIQEKLNNQKLATMEVEMAIGKAKAEADAQFYIANKELETVKQRLSKEYLNFEATLTLTNNLKLFVGDQIPDYIIFGKDEGGGVVAKPSK